MSAKPPSPEGKLRAPPPPERTLPAPLTEDLPEPSERAPRRRGRRPLLLAAAALSTAGVGGLGFMAYRRSEDRARAAEAQGLAARARESLREGHVLAAVADAAKALELAPDDDEVRRTWVHAEGVALIEGSPDHNRATGFMYKTWRFELRGPVLAFATLAHAVSVGNDRYAANLVEQHITQDVAEDALHLYATGAALDLMCSDRAEDAFARAGALWDGARLPPMRRARSLLFADRVDDAAAAVGATMGPAREVLAYVVGRLTGKRSDALWMDREAVSDLPRSLRAIAYVSTMSAENQVPMDILLEDVDAAITADLCARIALAAKDLPSAELAVRRACELRPELATAQQRLVAILLLRGDLEAARKRADATQDRDDIDLTEAVAAYERADLAGLRKLVGETDDALPLARWPSSVLAVNLLEKRVVELDHLKKRVAAQEPWADMLLFDAALAVGDRATLDAVIAAWGEASSPSRKARVERRKGLP